MTLCFLIKLLWTRVSKGFKKLNSNEAFINSFDYSLISSPTFLPLHSVVSTYRHSFIYLIHSFIYSYRHWPITHSRSLALSLIHSFIHSFKNSPSYLLTHSHIRSFIHSSIYSANIPLATKVRYDSVKLVENACKYCQVNKPNMEINKVLTF